MASFDRYTNYKNNVGVSSVVFGSDKPVLEVEVNELQEVQKNTLRKLLKSAYGGFGKASVSTANYCEFVSNKDFVLKPCTIIVDGLIIENTQTFSIEIGDTASISVPVYLDVWEETIDSSVTNLNVDGNYTPNTTPLLGTTQNYMKDSRTPSETSRRKVVKFKVTKEHDVRYSYVCLAHITSNQCDPKISSVFNLEEFNETLKDTFDSVNNSIKGINDKIGVIEMPKPTITGTLLNHEQLLNNLDSVTKSHSSSILTINSSINSIESDVNSLETNVGNLNNKIGNTSGIASLDSTGKVPSSQLPSFVDDVIEGYFYNSAFYKESSHTNLIAGETGKIYVDLAVTPSDSYRYSGSTYVKINNVGDSKANTVSFVEATTLENISTSETHAVLFGKVKKFFSMIGTTVLNTTNKTVTGAINELFSSISTLTTKVGSTTLTTTATNLSSAINEHETDLTGINTKLGSATLNTTAKDLSGALNEHETDLTSVNNKLGTSTLNTTAKDLSGAINEHENDMTNLTSKVGSATLTTTAQDLSGAVNEHETDLSGIATKLGTSTLNTTNKNVTAAINEHESDIIALNNMRGATNGLASLDVTGKVPASQLPSYVDDVLEGYYYNNAFYKELAHTNLITAETGKVYIDISVTPPESYRYSGSAYVKISNVGDSKGNIVSFTEATIDADILTGETHATLFGKIKKRFSIISTMFTYLYPMGYDNEKIYPLYSLVEHNGQIYMASQDINVVESWNPAHWSPCSLTEALNIMLSNGFGSTDRVVESGKTVNGFYEKWNSGKLVMWGKLTNVALNFPSRLGTTEFYGNTFNLTLPITPLTTSFSVVNVYGSGYSWGMRAIVYGGSLTYTVVQLDNVTRGHDIYFQVIGTWK